jgi:dTDP-4-amino-4,6-dideoxygalactose transaminase
MQNMKIPCLDIKRQYLSIKQEVLVKTEEVFDSNAFSGGKYVESFEKKFAEYCGTEYAMACNNGTTALHLALLALDIQPEDEIIVPANTFIATAWAVSYVGAKLVFVDCSPKTWLIDPQKIEEKITAKTKAIIGVHLYGQPFDIEAITAICKKHNLFLVEDAAQAQGAKYKGVKVGGFGDLACFSFYPGKNLGAYGEAGGLTTNNIKYFEIVQKLKNHGMTQRYYHDIIGYNYRMDGLQGAILEIKLKYLDSWNARRQSIANRYQNEIKNEAIQMQFQPEWAESIYHLFVVLVKNRQHFIDFMEKEGISLGLHYPVPCHLQKAYLHLGYQEGDFPVAEMQAKNCVSLPMFAEMTDEEVSYVIEKMNSYLQ